jgi:hypothetical protein
MLYDRNNPKRFGEDEEEEAVKLSVEDEETEVVGVSDIEVTVEVVSGKTR